MRVECGRIARVECCLRLSTRFENPTAGVLTDRHRSRAWIECALPSYAGSVAAEASGTLMIQSRGEGFGYTASTTRLD
jgi:hypothetical protein